ncbi:succinate dehydrogenase flavoprotein subunit [Anopheles sinensis]|uniref:Succinate dehydrogenase flavoprotein subunit n=1 Tax=Anopheles sinensis TaxID=74873 RepID=A0A084WSC2_ANOSI|nr:succinate dehydrogenase flavoprotein subunit [Anopheles sinensis]
MHTTRGGVAARARRTRPDQDNFPLRSYARARDSTGLCSNAGVPVHKKNALRHGEEGMLVARLKRFAGLFEPLNQTMGTVPAAYYAPPAGLMIHYERGFAFRRRKGGPSNGSPQMGGGTEDRRRRDAEPDNLKRWSEGLDVKKKEKEGLNQ